MNYYKAGDYNVTCDVCSKKMKASQARKRWDGFLVCASDFEERHPQDFVRSKQDRISVSETRPIPTLVYTNITYRNTEIAAYVAIAGIAIAGMAITGKGA
jgi:hypothetical protein